MIEFEDFGVAERIANDFGVEVGLTKIDVEDADSERRKSGEKSADGGAGDGIALRERAETNGVGGAGEGDPVFGKFHEVPGNIFSDVIFRLAFDVDIDFDRAGGVDEVALDAVHIEAAGFEVPESFLAETIISDAAGNDAGIAEERCDVSEIGGSAAELFASWEKIPQEFAEADDDGARNWGAGAHWWVAWRKILADGCGEMRITRCTGLPGRLGTDGFAIKANRKERV